MSKKQNKVKIENRNRKMVIISKAYLVAKNKINNCKMLCEEDKDALLDYQRYIHKIEKVFSLLDSVEQEIINNDFFYQSYPYWWTGIYSKTTYYRLRSNAVRKFVKAYDEN